MVMLASIDGWSFMHVAFLCHQSSQGLRRHCLPSCVGHVLVACGMFRFTNHSLRGTVNGVKSE